MFQIKRAYEKPEKEDGARILVERLWPRGLTKEKSAIDQWMKEIAPSAELRKWYGHDVAKWDEFRKRYRAELKDHKDLVEELREKGKKGRVSLIYAAHDEEHNSALVLKEYLEK
ncbi:MAG TPA: DUF488 domain-containing protein [Capsulimonadaceae bacterium]|nr:DUF488 domain-containing protein [Capsulimonadaceae bacterium]